MGAWSAWRAKVVLFDASIAVDSSSRRRALARCGRAAADVPRRRDAGQHRRDRARSATAGFVADLTRENFTVLEDGQPQTIASFTMVRGGRTYNLLTPPPRRRPRRKAWCCRRPGRASTTPPAACCCIFIDDLHFEPELTPHVRKLMQTIADTLIHEGDLVAVVSSGPSYLADRADLRQEDRHRGGQQDPRLRADPIRDLQDAGNVAGAGDIRQRAQLAFYTAYNILASSRRSTTSARPSSTSAPATTSIRSRKAATAATGSRAAAFPIRCGS